MTVIPVEGANNANYVHTFTQPPHVRCLISPVRGCGELRLPAPPPHGCAEALAPGLRGSEAARRSDTEALTPTARSALSSTRAETKMIGQLVWLLGLLVSGGEGNAGKGTGCVSELRGRCESGGALGRAECAPGAVL
ncbi:hypothetical protein AOLI_G00084450 [Acnodon oligacanthus]